MILIIDISNIRKEFIDALLAGSEQLDEATNKARWELRQRHDAERWTESKRREQEESELYNEINSARFLLNCLSAPEDSIQRRVADAIIIKLKQQRENEKEA